MRTTITLATLLIIFSFLGNSTSAQNQSDKNILLEYRFDGNGDEQSNSRFNLKINDDQKKMLFSWVSGKDGKQNTALEFKGNAPGFKPGINISPASMPEITFTAWVYGCPKGYLFGTTLPPNTASKITSRYLFFSGDNVSTGFMIYNDRAKQVNATYLHSADLPEDQWNFVALVINAKDSSLSLYAGEEYYQEKSGKDILKVFHTSKGGNLIIGNSDNLSSFNKFTGKVDEIRIYNKALTAAELTAISGITYTNVWERLDREDFIKRILLFALIIFYIVSIIYMIVIVFKEKKYKVVSDQEFALFVTESKSSTDISATNELAEKYMNDVFESWPVTEQQGENVFRAPSKRKHFKETYEALEKSRNLKPSEKHIIERMNELGELYNKLSKRRFYGNKALVVAALILPLIYFFVERNNMHSTMLNGLLVMLLPNVAYVLSSFAPTYVVANRGGKINKLFGGLFAVILGAGATVLATEYYTKTTWSDGSKTTEYDTSSNMVTLIIGLILLLAALILSMVLVGLSAIISFFRNYVFYF
ncbi:MAG: LamG domain-containing protein [Ignavibacteria bacterium]|nr:LamG domain-containing protein [Ignavibacteria bacterium]